MTTRPRNAAHALAVHISGLAIARGRPDERRAPGYRLRAAGVAVDLSRFGRLVAEASHAQASGDAGAAAAQLAAALQLWRGPALADLAGEHAARAERTQLDELRADVVVRRIDADLACGRHGELVPELRRPRRRDAPPRGPPCPSHARPLSRGSSGRCA